MTGDLLEYDKPPITLDEFCREGFRTDYWNLSATPYSASKTEPLLVSLVNTTLMWWGLKKTEDNSLPKYLLAYDVDCGPCKRFKQVVDFMDPQERIDFLSLNEADDLGLLDRVPRPKRHTSFHLIFPDGEVQSGAEALPSVIEVFPLGELFSKGVSVPGWWTLVEGIYSVLSRLHDRGSCRYQSALAGKRASRGKNALKTLTFPKVS